MTDDTNRIEQHDPAKHSPVVRRDVDGSVVKEPAVKPDILDILGLRGPGSGLDDRPEPQVIDVPLARMEARRG